MRSMGEVRDRWLCAYFPSPIPPLTRRAPFLSRFAGEDAQ